MTLFAKHQRGNPDAFRIRYDVHNHLLPGVDDGVETPEEAWECISSLISLGYEGAVLTPHIHPDLYDNSEAELREKFARFQDETLRKFPDFKLQLGAEYFFDETLIERLSSRGSEILGFGPQKSWLLVEFSILNLPLNWEELFMACRTQSMQLIIAHVERYAFLHQNWKQLLPDWLEKGAWLQMNLGSLAGQYGPVVAHTARNMLSKSTIHFLGTDLHRPKFLPKMQEALRKFSSRKSGFSSGLQDQVF